MTSRMTEHAPPAETAAKWISPANAAAILKSVPTAHEDVSFALLPNRSNKPGQLSDLIQAKLQPRQPTAAERVAAGPLWPKTAFDHRLILARRVPKPPSIEQLVADYSSKVVDYQATLAMVLTCHFDADDMFPHDAMALTSIFTELYFANLGLTSILMQHQPGEALSKQRPHIHIVAFGRTHSIGGWAGVPDHFNVDGVGHWVDKWETVSAVFR